jgi:hypothetical protein
LLFTFVNKTFGYETQLRHNPDAASTRINAGQNVLPCDRGALSGVRGLFICPRGQIISVVDVLFAEGLSEPLPCSACQTNALSLLFITTLPSAASFCSVQFCSGSHQYLHAPYYFSAFCSVNTY